MAATDLRDGIVTCKGTATSGRSRSALEERRLAREAYRSGPAVAATEHLQPGPGPDPAGGRPAAHAVRAGGRPDRRPGRGRGVLLRAAGGVDGRLEFRTVPFCTRRCINCLSSTATTPEPTETAGCRPEKWTVDTQFVVHHGDAAPRPLP